MEIVLAMMGLVQTELRLEIGRWCLLEADKHQTTSE
jgi:hypothetical protein